MNTIKINAISMKTVTEIIILHTLIIVLQKSCTLKTDTNAIILLKILLSRIMIEHCNQSKKARKHFKYQRTSIRRFGR